jgi:hypothetical protein
MNQRVTRVPTAVRKVSMMLLGAVAIACAPPQSLPAQPPATVAAALDSLDPNYVPAGYGSLKRDEIVLLLAPGSGLQVRAVPLDERVIRLLAPDNYRSLRELPLGKVRAIEAAKERTRLPSYSIWLVSFYALEQGETRFSPGEFIITNVGRDFRPLEIIPLTTGFGEHRLSQRQTHQALFIFDGQLDVNQPLTAQMEGARSVTDWNEVLRKMERERALVRSRAATAVPAKRDSSASIPPRD